MILPRHALLVTILFCGAAQAEDCWNGPGGIGSRLDSTANIDAPQGGSVTLNFSFNAAWENMVFVCDAATHQLLTTKGNYSRDRSDWTSPNNGRAATYVIAAFHKKISPDAGDAGSYPWRQSAMHDLTPDPLKQRQQQQFGFNDEGGLRFDNALVTVNYTGDRTPRPPRPTVSLSIAPSSVVAGPAITETIHWVPLTGSHMAGAAVNGQTGAQSAAPAPRLQTHSTTDSVRTVHTLPNELEHDPSVLNNAPNPIHIEGGGAIEHGGVIERGGVADSPGPVPRVNISWSSTNADKCNWGGELSGEAPPSGQMGINGINGELTIGVHEYRLTCNGGGGTSDSALARLTVTPAPPTVSLTVAPTTIKPSQNATLTWATTGANTCHASGETGWSGAEPLAGTLSVSPNIRGAHVYKLSCDGDGFTSTTATATLTVN